MCIYFDIFLYHVLEKYDSASANTKNTIINSLNNSDHWENIFS